MFRRRDLPEAVIESLRWAYIQIIAIVLVVSVIPAALMMWVQYKGLAEKIYAAQVIACQKVIQDRRVNLEGWEIARQARIDAANHAETRVDRRMNLIVVHRYSRIIRSLQSRAEIRCQDVIPKP